MNLQPTRIESLPARSRKAAEYQILKDYYTAELEKENARLALEEDDGFVADIIKNTKSKINY